jgi:hypothetical protein
VLPKYYKQRGYGENHPGKGFRSEELDENLWIFTKILITHYLAQTFKKCDVPIRLMNLCAVAQVWTRFDAVCVHAFRGALDARIAG